MKHLFKTLIFASTLVFLFIIAACSKNDTEDPIKKEEVVEQPEEKPVEQPTEVKPSTEESNLIAENVIIKGGTKIEGTPPIPNEAITVDFSEVDKSAVLDEGFVIPIRSEADISGAYIQFKAIDGGVSESYYNVDLLENQEGPELNGKRRKKIKGKSKKILGRTAKSTDSELDIDFGAEIKPGEFCYIICVYDTAGNISAPQEICVTVGAWGGNKALVGSWDLKRWEGFDEGTTETETVGEEYCFEFGCETQEYATITFEEDGTYEYNERYIEREVGGNYGQTFDEYVERGKWSYPDGDDGDLILVEYYYSEENEEGFQEETYTVGEAYTYVLPAESIELTETKLTITDRYDDDGDGNFEEIYTEFYEKQ